MNALLRAALEIQDFFKSRQWDSYIIGGLAVSRWGEPRATQDIDMTLITRFEHEEAYIEILLGRFESRVPDAPEFALRNRVALLSASNGVPIDVALGGIPFEESALKRATFFEFAPGAVLRTCSAEDLIVLKAFADRLQDWLDVEGILIRQGGKLDWEYVLRHLGPLCDLKESLGIVTRLTALHRSVRGESGDAK